MTSVLHFSDIHFGVDRDSDGSELPYDYAGTLFM